VERNTELDLSAPRLVVVAQLAVTLLRINLAILKVVESIALWVSGKPGANALAHAVVVRNKELVACSHLLLAVAHLVKPQRIVSLATHKDAIKKRTGNMRS
jgi:hypothetical protein